MIDSSHPYFRDPESLERLLAEKFASGEGYISTRPYGQFSTIHRPKGVKAEQGYVWTDTWIVGVWATYDPNGRNVETTFYTVVNGDLQIQTFENSGWGTSEVVAQAAHWFDRDYEI